MWKTVLLALLGGVAFMALVGPLLFGCAGRLDLPLFWAYLGVMMAAAVVGPFVTDPTLVKERLRPGPGGKDYLIELLATPLWLGQFVLAGLSVGRFQWTWDAVPLAVQVIGLAAMAVAMAV